MPDTLPFGKDREPDYPDTEDRKRLSDKQKAELCLKQSGKCAGCQKKPLHGWEFDHVNELWECGTNALDNWQAFGSRKDCECHAIKTGKAAKRRAKQNRLRGKAGQLKRRRENGSKLKSRSTFSDLPKPQGTGGGFRKPPGFKTKWPKRKMQTRKA